MAQGEHHLMSHMEDQIRKCRARTHATGDGARASSSHPTTYSRNWIRISEFSSIQHPKSSRYARRRRSISMVQIPPSNTATLGSGTTVMVTKRFAPVVSLPKLEPALMSSLLEHPFVGPEIDFKSICKDVRIVREEFAIPCSRPRITDQCELLSITTYRAG
jgi:hypothetical protein